MYTVLLINFWLCSSIFIIDAADILYYICDKRSLFQPIMLNSLCNVVFKAIPKKTIECWITCWTWIMAVEVHIYRTNDLHCARAFFTPQHTRTHKNYITFSCACLLAPCMMHATNARNCDTAKPSHIMSTTQFLPHKTQREQNQTCTTHLFWRGALFPN